jgi:hypothetical protein
MDKNKYQMRTNLGKIINKYGARKYGLNYAKEMKEQIDAFYSLYGALFYSDRQIKTMNNIMKSITSINTSNMESYFDYKATGYELSFASSVVSAYDMIQDINEKQKTTTANLILLNLLWNTATKMYFVNITEHGCVNDIYESLSIKPQLDERLKFDINDTFEKFLYINGYFNKFDSDLYGDEHAFIMIVDDENRLLYKCEINEDTRNYEDCDSEIVFAINIGKIF